MALSKQTVLEIIRVVSNDPDCKQRTNSWLRFVDIADSGLAGLVRNYSIGFLYTYTPESMAKNLDPSERGSMAYEYSCDGIAEVTTKAIKANLDSIPAVQDVSEQARASGFSHTGTMLKMKDGSKYVLDWWKSLNLSCPFVFRYDDFMYRRNDGIPSTDFKGFSD